jgi:hypothetical protein
LIVPLPLESPVPIFIGRVRGRFEIESKGHNFNLATINPNKYQFFQILNRLLNGEVVISLIDQNLKPIFLTAG